MKIHWLIVLLCWSDSSAQDLTGKGIGRSELHFDSNTLQISSLAKEDCLFCGKLLREAIPINIFGDWTQVEYSIANGENKGKIFTYLAKIFSVIIDTDSDLRFQSYEEMRKAVILQPIRIDSRISIGFARDSQHPLLGSNYIILNVDSQKNLIHVKYGNNEGILYIK